MGQKKTINRVKVSFVLACFFQMMKMIAQSIVSTSSPQRASRVFKLNSLYNWLLFVFCLKNPLSQISTLDGMSIIFYQSCISLVHFVCFFKLLPHMRQASNNVLFSHSCQPQHLRISPIFN